jgi:hypothetical protein
MRSYLKEDSGSCLEKRDYGLHLKKLALTSPTSDGRSVVIVRTRTQATEFVVCFV